MRRAVFGLIFVASILALTGCGGADAGGKDIPKINVGNMTLFQAADDPESTAKLDMIISSGVDLNAKDKEGKTALHHAAEADNGNAVKRLVRADADTTIQDANGHTAEEVAKQGGKMNALKAFAKVK